MRSDVNAVPKSSTVGFFWARLANKQAFYNRSAASPNSGVCAVLLLPITALVLATVSFASNALAQAYTYDPPACGALWRPEAAKPEALHVVWEMNSASQCVQQSNFPMACRHYRAALAAADHMEPEAGDPEGLKVQLRTMLKINGCQ